MSPPIQSGLRRVHASVPDAPASHRDRQGREDPSPSRAEAIDPLDLYAGGIDTSDYVARALPLIHAAVPQVGELLDIGAGGGQLGSAVRDPAATWTAIEPAPVMQQRLLALDPPPRLHPVDWQGAELPLGCADTVLAANMPAPLTEPSTFLKRCRVWARQTVVWLVPAQHGPRGLCLAGCLPRAWHGEDETPGIDIVLRGLSQADKPAIVAQADWTFSLTVGDLTATATYLAGRLGWPPTDPRRSELRSHLEGCAVRVAGGHRLDVPRSSAVLVWRLPS